MPEASTPHSEPKPCGRRVYWWDGEYEGECQLPKGHEGDHFDDLSWYDDEGTNKDYEHTDE